MIKEHAVSLTLHNPQKENNLMLEILTPANDIYNFFNVGKNL